MLESTFNNLDLMLGDVRLLQKAKDIRDHYEITVFKP